MHVELYVSPCVRCNELFLPKRETHKYCSETCLSKQMKANEKARTHRTPLKPILCRECTRRFVPVKRSNTVFCTPLCKNMYWARTRAELKIKQRKEKVLARMQAKQALQDEAPKVMNRPFRAPPKQWFNV